MLGQHTTADPRPLGGTLSRVGFGAITPRQESLAEIGVWCPCGVFDGFFAWRPMGVDRLTDRFAALDRRLAASYCASARLLRAGWQARSGASPQRLVLCAA